MQIGRVTSYYINLFLPINPDTFNLIIGIENTFIRQMREDEEREKERKVGGSERIW